MNEARLHVAARRAARCLGIPARDVTRVAGVLRNELARLLCAEQSGAAAVAADEPLDITPRPARPQKVRYVTDDEDGGSYVKIPFLPKAEDARPLKKAIQYAADKMHVSPYLVAELMTYFLEAVADRVSLGHVVRIPGFGVFGPWLWESKHDGKQSVYPRFVAARPFRLQVRSICDPPKAKNDVLARFQRSHHPSSRPDKVTSQVWKAMDAMREQFRRQGGYYVGEDCRMG
jgi:hypothetical protein